MTGRRRWCLLALLVSVVAPACAETAGSSTTSTSTTAAPSTTTTSTTVPTTTTTTTTVPTTTTSTTPPPPRVAVAQAWTPFAQVGPVEVVHPSGTVELVAFHESNHDGAQQLAALPSAVRPTTLESRERDTGPQGAVDIVVDPAREIRSPVSGRVKRGGGYTLYCDHRDHFVVIEPDARPGWEVKLLHIDGLFVKAGDRVEAGVTVLAPRPRKLPFESQVDEITADPPWPHVHLEVVDPSIPDRPSEGGGC